ncbi:cytochrome P450 [Amycolatopsis antarctica]|uniref:Cytochrome P450 n=1 Tax=Amycolatopsis antarctica TaxID=1854586 RepID=A0A263CZP8_9PSEU|nr:cytochrome P450 [Amycolatopsis antarctica]OZM70776.1 cytochrome P450 [Amycolatopsis antarctica]
MSAAIWLPFEQPGPVDVAPVLSALQAEGAVHRVHTAVGDEAWLITSYPLVRDLLADERLGRSHPVPETAARTGESALFGGPMGDFDTEHADHARMRALLQPLFTPKRMRALDSRVETLTTELLDKFADRPHPADLVAAVAVPLPILVICELLGVPYADRDRFRSWTRAAADIRERARSERGLADLFGYGKDLVARKRADPGDDVISRLCEADGVSDDEIAALSMSLLFAGHETTVVHIGLGALLLLTNPDQRNAVLEDHHLVGSAVEEMLRAPGKTGGGIPRYARADFEIGGVTIHAGELVLLDTSAGNHDPADFPNPDRFDVTRRDAPHLTFGHGLRYCIGAPLARMELRAVFSQLIPRFPDIRLAVPVHDLRTHRNTLTGGLTALPVRW